MAVGKELLLSRSGNERKREPNCCCHEFRPDSLSSRPEACCVQRPTNVVKTSTLCDLRGRDKTACIFFFGSSRLISDLRVHCGQWVMAPGSPSAAPQRLPGPPTTRAHARRAAAPRVNPWVKGSRRKAPGEAAGKLLQMILIGFGQGGATNRSFLSSSMPLML